MTLSLRLPVYAVAGAPTPAHTHSLKKKKKKRLVTTGKALWSEAYNPAF